MKVFEDLTFSFDKVSAVVGEEVLVGSVARESRSPIDNKVLKIVADASPDILEIAITKARSAFEEWRLVPAPKRGELVRIYGNLLREHKKDLANILSLEVGKIISEAEGEVQEMIDICDMAVGQSRQLFGFTIASERPGHRLMEQWHPLGVVGVISAFNFPMAVWAWNAMMALVCGNTIVWKPSEKAPLSALACHALLIKAVEKFGSAPKNLCSVVLGGATLGEVLCRSEKVPLVSATGSTRMGKAVAGMVSKRLGRYLLELGGNNAMIVAPSADLELAVRAITFSAVGTAGQRCTTLRRLIVHSSVKNELMNRLKKVYASVVIGSPLEENTLVGPLIDERAFLAYEAALAQAKAAGAIVFNQGRADVPLEGVYVKPVIVEIDANVPIVKEETFAPILYVTTYKTFDEAIEINNNVTQGLSSAIFTKDLKEAELFMSASGSDCGITNVNIGTSGAEVGGAFGGEKDTGGGRECGSDVWKSYMRRSTNTINYSDDLPLAQGVSFL